jgi:preprotein translocase subunit SecE
MKFFKDSIRELKHVVWPSKKETINFFLIVVVTLVLFWIYLTVADFLFREGLFGLKGIFSK